MWGFDDLISEDETENNKLNAILGFFLAFFLVLALACIVFFVAGIYASNHEMTFSVPGKVVEIVYVSEVVSFAGFIITFLIKLLIKLITLFGSFFRIEGITKKIIIFVLLMTLLVGLIWGAIGAISLIHNTP